MQLNGTLTYNPVVRASVTYAVLKDAEGRNHDLVAFANGRNAAPQARDALGDLVAGDALSVEGHTETTDYLGKRSVKFIISSFTGCHGDADTTPEPAVQAPLDFPGVKSAPVPRHTVTLLNDTLRPAGLGTNEQASWQIGQRKRLLANRGTSEAHREILRQQLAEIERYERAYSPKTNLWYRV